MIRVLNMTKIGMVDSLPEFKFDFEFDNASALPVKTYLLGSKTYIIAEDSTAINIATKTSYKYNGIESGWVKVLSTTEPTPVKPISTITTNGDYNIVNNNFEGYNDITVKVPGDIPSVLTTKDITINGTYNAEDDDAEGYSTVTVNVANSYTASDEGKVVDNGTLIAQTSTNITSNGTVNTTTNNEVVVNVPNTYATEDEGKVVSNGALVSQTSTNITSNGIYTTTTNNEVVVAVPNSYTADDNGKVVSNQELVAQTAYPTEITENNTYDTTNFNSITVNVSGGGGGGNIVAYFDLNGNGYTYYLEDENNVIGFEAFNDCSTLSSITISNGVTAIENSAFYNCDLVSSITIPDSVISIGAGAFYNCSNIETVTFESNSSLDSIGSNAFLGCSALSSITIPNSVTTIGDYAFQLCSSLTSITIPDNVTSIGLDVFDNCEALETITFEPTTPPELGGDLGIDTTCTIRVPQGTLADYTSAQYYPDPSEYTYEEY